MSLDHLQSRYGFTRTPFGTALAPQMLHLHASHAEAVARISGCSSERALGVVTGEVGAGKTVAIGAALGGLDASRHTTIYLGNPAVDGRGLYYGIITALGGTPRFHKAALIPQTTEMLAAKEHEHGRTVVLVLDEAPFFSSTRPHRQRRRHIKRGDRQQGHPSRGLSSQTPEREHPEWAAAKKEWDAIDHPQVRFCPETCAHNHLRGNP